MATGKKPASKASKELSNKRSTKDEKTVAASDLAQAKRKFKGQPSGSTSAPRREPHRRPSINVLFRASAISRGLEN